MAQVVCLGELLVDMVSETPDVSLQEARGFLKAPGGAPANVAVGLQRLGIFSAFISQVGDDPFGAFLREVVAREGVDVSGLLTSQTARTTLAFIATRSDGRKDICFYRNPGADAQFRPEDVPLALFDGAEIFHCGSVTLSQSPAREAQLFAAQAAHARGLLVSYDPNWRPSLWPDADAAREILWQMMPLSDIVKLAEEEWAFVTGTSDLEAGARKIREVGPRLVVVTRGEDGAYFDCASARGQVDGFAVEALDTLGAGDSFMSGLLSRIVGAESLDSVLNASSLRPMLRFANGCGALATLKSGAIPALPTRTEVEAFVENRSI